jgi:uncharacterized membrane protein
MTVAEPVYALSGGVLAIAALHDWTQRRHVAAAFWGVLALVFIGGDAVAAAAARGEMWPARCTGAALIVLGLLAASGRLRRDTVPVDAAQAARRAASAQRLGHRLWLPALTIPLGTLLLSLLFPAFASGLGRLDRAQSTVLAFAVACLCALGFAWRLTRAPLRTVVEGTTRLLDALSWAALLPMLLATLGGVFAATGVGETIARWVSVAIPIDSAAACVVAYALGMVAFTVILGNAFAAFPVLTAGIGLPLLIGRHHADPSALSALGMLTGYCGTLLTPMAANFNVVPAALLELSDPYAVIRAQWPIACGLFAFNLTLLYLVVCR